MKRTVVAENRKWKLEDIFLTQEQWEKEAENFRATSSEVLRFQGKLNNPREILECLEFTDKINKTLEKLYAYAMLYSDTDLGNQNARELKGKIETAFVAYSAQASFIMPELSKLDTEFLEKLAADKKFADYSYMLEGLIKNRPHILSEAEEKILAKASKTTGAFREIFTILDNVDLEFAKITVDGEKKTLTHGNFSLLLQHPDKETRKKAFSSYYKTYERFINTIAVNYASSVNKDNFVASVRNYPSALEKSLSANDVPKEVYTTLVKKVNDALPLLHDYMHLRKKTLGLAELTMHDLHVPMIEKTDIALDYEAAYKLVIEGLSPLGSEYQSLVRLAYDKRWIDVEETENKRSGAYSASVYGVHPFVLLNYKPTTHDIFTIAHELGHALHSHYSNLNQPYVKADYSIFVAEVASTVNEVLLLKHLLKTNKDPKARKYLLSYYLDMFRTTLFRQTQFAEFEKDIHDSEQRGTVLTADFLSNSYAKLNKKYYGSAVKQNRQIKYEWARIPHFYRAFYVYQYATGLTAAINIASKILNGESRAIENYRKFLSAGGHKSPYEILKDCGVDLKTEKPYEVAFSEFSEALEQLK